MSNIQCVKIRLKQELRGDDDLEKVKPIKELIKNPKNMVQPEQIFDVITNRAKELYFPDKRTIKYQELIDYINGSILNEYEPKYAKIDPTIRAIGENVEHSFGMEITNSNELSINENITEDIYERVLAIVKEIKYGSRMPTTCDELTECLNRGSDEAMGGVLSKEDVESYVKSVRAIIETSFKPKG